MLSTSLKANILRKAGVPIPAMGADAMSGDELKAAASQWANTVETLYVIYTAARAAKSLRDAEEARQLVMLRHMAWGSRA
jgi:hypothetical protein